MKPGDTYRKLLPIGRAAACGGCLVWMLASPQTVTNGVRAGISLCLESVIPALFSFLVLGEMLLPFLLRMSGGKRLPFVMILVGTLCGFPVGAKLSASLYDAHAVTREEGAFLCAVSNQASAAFLIGFAGGTVLGDIRMGVALVAAELMAALLSAFLLRRLFFPQLLFSPGKVFPKVSLPSALRGAVRNTAEICAGILFFRALSELVLTLFPPQALLQAMVRGILEISAGIAACKNLMPLEALPLVALIAGWGGFCVHIQVFSVVDGRFPLRFFALQKIFTAVILFAVFLLTKFFGLDIILFTSQ